LCAYENMPALTSADISGLENKLGGAEIKFIDVLKTPLPTAMSVVAAIHNVLCRVLEITHGNKLQAGKM